MSITLETDLLNLRRKNIILTEERKKLREKSTLTKAEQGHIERLTKDINKNRKEERNLRYKIRDLRK